MKQTLVEMVKRLFSLAGLLSLVIIPAFAQTRIIEWQTQTFGSTSITGEDIQFSSTNAVLEIIGFSVEGKPVTPGEPFAAGDEWLKTLKVRLRNVSGRPIKWSQMSFVLPDSRTRGKGGIIVRLQYGSVPTESLAPIEPGKEFELSMREWHYENIRTQIEKRENPEITNRLFITVTSVDFSDGTSWASECIKAANAKSSCSATANASS